MAYTASNLFLHSNAPGDMKYVYDAGDDTMLTVITSAYFDDGPNAAPKLAAGDLIYCKCADGNMWLKVSGVVASTGVASCYFAGGDLPVRTWATGTAAGDFPMRVGYYEVGTSVATGTRGWLPTPYPGAVVQVQKIDSGTEQFAFDAGASGSDVSYGASDAAAGGGTAVTYDGTNRRIVLRAEGEGFRVRATSTSRWRIEYLNHHASAISEGASVVMPGT
jgi:hypothetical protein